MNCRYCKQEKVVLMGKTEGRDHYSVTFHCNVCTAEWIEDWENTSVKRIEQKGDTIYKVVRVKDGFKCSIMGDENDAHYTTYAEYKVSTPPEHLLDDGYGITAFEDLEQALNFRLIVAAHAEMIQVWRCEGFGKMDLVPRLPTRWLSEDMDRSKVPFDMKHEWPIGTVMYRAVKLSRRMA